MTDRDHVPGTVLFTLCHFSHFICTVFLCCFFSFFLSSLQLSGQELFFVSGFQTRHLRPWEVKQLAQGPPLVTGGNCGPAQAASRQSLRTMRAAGPPWRGPGPSRARRVTNSHPYRAGLGDGLHLLQTWSKASAGRGGEIKCSTLQYPGFLWTAGMIQEGFTEEVSFALGLEGQPRAQCFWIGRKQKNRESQALAMARLSSWQRRKEMKARTLSLESLLYMDVGGGVCQTGELKLSYHF